jgi:hypothetical protein
VLLPVPKSLEDSPDAIGPMLLGENVTYGLPRGGIVGLNLSFGVFEVLADSCSEGFVRCDESWRCIVSLPRLP